MKRLIFYIIILILPLPGLTITYPSKPVTTEAAEIYSLIEPDKKGLSDDVFQIAYKGYKKLLDQNKIKKSNLITIVDFTQSSKNKRLYVIDLLNHKIIHNTYVAHGKNTGEEFARNFSNQVGSLKSSPGFYITQQPIMGGHVGFSLVIDGIEKGINDNAIKREIIMHGADYATEKFIARTGRLGRSFGCPALPPDQIRPVVETIKDGSCLFIYTKDMEYLSKSSVLN